MKQLTQGEFDRLVERWNAKNAKVGSRIKAVNTCRDEGHSYAVSPLTGGSGCAVLVCTRCLTYVEADRAA